jgi:hypothetical protein
VFAVVVVLVLAVWGLLLLQAPRARADHGADTLALPQPISRDAVRRSYSHHASRAPGLLCERALGFNMRRTRLQTGPRAFRPARWSGRMLLRAHSFMRTVCMRA